MRIFFLYTLICFLSPPCNFWLILKQFPRKTCAFSATCQIQNYRNRKLRRLILKIKLPEKPLTVLRHENFPAFKAAFPSFCGQICMFFFIFSPFSGFFNNFLLSFVQASLIPVRRVLCTNGHISKSRSMNLILISN